MLKADFKLVDTDNLSANAQAGILEKITLTLLLALPFLTPVFFIPSNSFPFQFSKVLLLSVLVLISFACWILSRLRDGQFVFSAITITYSSLAIVAVATISALASGTAKWGLVGQGFELGTVASLAVLFILMFLVPTVFRSKDRIFYAYLSFFTGVIIVAIFHILRLIFGAGFLSLGLFNEVTSNTIGKWNDLGIFFGVGAVVSLITLEMISLSKPFKSLLYGTLVVSLFFLALVNFSPVWYVLSIFSLIFLVYTVSLDKGEVILNDSTVTESVKKNPFLSRLPITSTVVLAISLVFIIGSNTVGVALANKLNISQIEARPSWLSTISIAKSVIARDPLLGSGPNRFANKWLANKPDGINSTIFWNTDFNFGIGLVPTFLVTTGILGALTWIIFLGLYLLVGFKAILSSIKDKFSRYLLVLSFLVSLFLWIINVFYIPDLTIVSLTFFFTGLFIASIYESNVVKPKVISFTEDPRMSFASILCLILLLIGTVSVGYSMIEKYTSAVYFQKGVIIGASNLDKSEGYFLKAVALDSTVSAYYRALVQVDMLRMSTLLSQNTNISSVDALRTKFQGLLSGGLNYAQLAVQTDRTDYQNWVSLAQVYEAIVPLKITNAYESAVDSYKQALVLNPKSPSILLSMAKLNATHGDNVKAKEYIRQALQQRNSYTDAIFLLAQIQVAEGNIKDAIESVQSASYLSPNDSGIIFQLGLLRYSNKDFAGAVTALEQAITLNPTYANAKYFLGLCYQRLGRVADAIKQFKDLKVTNPNNTEIDLILKNLNAGLAPFANAKPPIDNQPEKRPKPPVVDKAPVKNTTTKPAPAGSDTVDTSSL